MNILVDEVKDINGERTFDNLERRYIKLMEEIGEVAEAYLNITSKNNFKLKSWSDVREEILDCFIVCLDIVLTTQESFDEPDFVEVIPYDKTRFELYMKQIRTSEMPIYEIWEMLHIAFPDQPDISKEEIRAQFKALGLEKLEKWKRSSAIPTNG